MPASKKTSVGTRAFPSVSQGYVQAWDVFGKTWLKQLLLGVISGVVSFFFTALVFVLFFVVNSKGVMGILDMMKTGQVNPEYFTGTFFVSIMAMPIVWIIGLVVITMLFTVTVIKLVNNAYDHKESSIGELIKTSLPKVFPLIVVSTIVSIFAMGGLMLFIIPGIVISTLLTFSVWEVVVGNKGIIAAMKESNRVVRANFWAVLGRVLLFGGLIFIVNIVTNLITNIGGDGENATMFGSVVSTIIQVVAQYFAMAYSVVLYKQAKAAATGAPEKGLLGIIVVSVVGWIVGILFWATVISVAIQAVKIAADEAMKQNALDTSGYEQMIELEDTRPNTRLQKATPAPVVPLKNGR